MVVLSHICGLTLLGTHRGRQTYVEYVYFLTESGIKGLLILSQENLSIKLNVRCVALLVFFVSACICREKRWND